MTVSAENRKWRYKKRANSFCYEIRTYLQLSIQRPSGGHLKWAAFSKTNSTLQKQSLGGVL